MPPNMNFCLISWYVLWGKVKNQFLIWVKNNVFVVYFVCPEHLFDKYLGVALKIFQSLDLILFFKLNKLVQLQVEINLELLTRKYRNTFY